MRKALTNPVYFAEVYIRPYDPKWTTAMPPHGQEMVYNALANERTVTILPPEFAKTTFISQALPVWLTLCAVAEGRLFRGMLLSEEEAMAKNNLRAVAWHLTENERIAADFSIDGKPIVRPSAAEDVWRDDAIIVDRPFVSKDPTWKAKGISSKGIRGSRLDWVIADDLITATGDSPANRRAAQIVWDNDVETRLVEGGHAALVGNFISDQDLLHDLGAREGWTMIRRPSIYVNGSPSEAPRESDLWDEESTSLLWPDVWSRERLRKLYVASPARFKHNHLLDPLAEGGEKLDPDWVTLVDSDDIDASEARLYMAIDPAPGGETADLDFFVVSVLASFPDSASSVLVESYATRTPMGNQAALVGAIHDRWARVGYGVKAIGISKVALDRYFRQALVAVRRDLDRKIEPISTPGSKEERLESLGAVAMSGQLRVLRAVWERKTSSHRDRHQELTLREEWSSFPLARHDDRLDALDLALRVEELKSAAGRRTVRMATT